jgi:hypothetical protein
LGITRAVEIDPNLNPGFQSVALDRRDACRHPGNPDSDSGQSRRLG